VYVGIGIRSGSVLAVTFEIPVPLIAVYDIDTSLRTLRGKYSAFPPGGRVEREVLTFSHGLKNDWQVGNALLGNWSQDPFWYPGTVIAMAPDEDHENRYRVRFADGDQEWLGPSRMMPDQLTVGDLVYQTCGLFHHADEPTGPGPILPEDVDANRLTRACRVVHRDGDTLELESPDGRRDRTSIKYIRTIAPRETPLSHSTNISEQ